ncbi:MAG: efflux RND transporter periplasmic adaptor subunit [Thermoanaerobaculia bacterium]
MTRSKQILAVALALAVPGVAAVALRSRVTDEIPTLVVGKQRFVREVTAEGVLKAAKATPIAIGMEIRGRQKIGWLIGDGAAVKTGDVVVRLDPTELQKNVDDGRSQVTTADNKIVAQGSRAGAERTNLYKDARQAELELEAARTFQKKDAEIFSRNNIIESEIDEALALRKRDFATGVLGVRDRLALAEYGLLMLERQKADMLLSQASRSLAAIEVRAPHDGVIVFERDWRGNMPRVGDTAYPGFKFAEIPDLGKMNAEVYLLEADAGGAAIGQSARVIVESVPGREFEAKVTAIEPVAKPRFRGVPVQYFGVTLELKTTDRAVMKPGTRVRAILRLDDKKAVVALPRQALFDKDGEKFVYRKNAQDGFDPVEVSVGASSAGRIVIDKGIVEGDVIALVEPPHGDEETSPKGESR